MSFTQLVDELSEQHAHHPSLEGQIKVFAIHHWLKTVPGKDGPDLGKQDMGEALDAVGLELGCNLNTAVDNLVGADLLGSYEPNGPDWYIIRERDGEFVLGDDFPPAVHEECQRAIEHIRSMDPSDDEGTPAVADGGHTKTNDAGETLREEVAANLDVDVDSGDLDDWLRVGNAQIRREKLEELVEVIRDSETFALPNSFDEIKLIPKGFRYHRSKKTLSSI